MVCVSDHFKKIYLFARDGLKMHFFILLADYVLGERKFGGSAQSITKDRWLHHTSFLWDYHMSRMAYLKIPKRAPEYRAVSQTCCLDSKLSQSSFVYTWSILVTRNRFPLLHLFKTIITTWTIPEHRHHQSYSYPVNIERIDIYVFPIVFHNFQVPSQYVICLFLHVSL